MEGYRKKKHLEAGNHRKMWCWGELYDDDTKYHGLYGGIIIIPMHPNYIRIHSIKSHVK